MTTISFKFQNMETLPNDAVRHIVSFLSIPQRIQITRVCKRFLNSICYHESLWREVSLFLQKDIVTDEYFNKLIPRLAPTQSLDLTKCKGLVAPLHNLSTVSRSLVSLNLSYITFKVSE